MELLVYFTSIFLKLSVNPRMAQPMPKHVALLDKIEFRCV